MKFLKFLISRVFLKNLLLAIAIGGLFVFSSLKFLDIYSQHGKAITLPNLSGLTLEEISHFSISKNLEYIVIDSVYDDNKKKGAIILQDPPPNSQVKNGRKIYLTIIASETEVVRVPDVKNLSVRQAVTTLENAGLNIGILYFVKSFDRNAVLNQFYNGDTLKADMELDKGSVVDLEIGRGLTEYNVPVPFLIGLNRSEAHRKIRQASLNVGEEHFSDDFSPEHARISYQSPSCTTNTMLELGAYINIWYRSELSFNFDSLIELYQADTLEINIDEAEDLTEKLQ